MEKRVGVISRRTWITAPLVESGYRKGINPFSGPKPFALCFSQDGKYLASADIWQVNVWRLSDQKCIHKIELRRRASNPPTLRRVMAFLPDSKSIVVGGTRQVRQIDLESGDFIATFDTLYWGDNLWNLERSTRGSWQSANDEITLVSVSS